MKHPTSTHSFGKVAFWSILLSILLLIVMSLSITLGAASIDFIVVWKVVLSKIPIVQNWGFRLIGRNQPKQLFGISGCQGSF